MTDMIIVANDEPCPVVPHWHLNDPKWTIVADNAIPIMLITVAYHEPERGILESVSCVIEPPHIIIPRSSL